ncbi:MAG: peptidoglycan DD-metalloendopeptidase family protein, partial [Candidatus Hydrothermarchaeales archaeon]
MISIEDGEVVDTGVFTSSDKVSYWNTAYYVLIKNKAGFVCRYAELADVAVVVGGAVKAGQLIGHVGLVLDSDKIA